jgi:signal transduction histidine kinase/CheY-like chemotaxis protein
VPQAKSSRSIGFRLSFVVVAAVFVGVLASVSFFLFHDFRQTVAAEKMRLESSAAAFAAAASESVAAADHRGAMEVLRGIRDLSHVVYAQVSDGDGRVLAEMGGATMLVGRDGALDGKDALSMFFAESLTVSAEVRRGGAVIGSVLLQAEIGWLRERYVDSFTISLVFGLVLMLITSIVARTRIARIIKPLTVLADEFADIGQRSDLTKRLQADRDDEVGVLIHAFNDMFSRIDERDRQLKRHRDTLEETVEIRTAEMRAARDEAERANAAKSDFLATMSHEIRTPMNGMMVMAEMLSAAPLSEKHLRYTEIITRSGQGLLNIINDILDFSKIEAGRLELEEIPFSLDTLVEDVASLFSERAREKNLTIATCIAPDVPLRLIGDPTRINQVLTNLVNNALKFTEAGGVTIEVMRIAQPPTDGRARIEVHVRDTGIGIAADKIGQIFERFTQADQTITRKFGGTGLGLSISKKLIDAMGGGIAVASEPGVGSDFNFSLALPVVEEAAGESLGGARVLILDDDPVTAAAAECALAARGAVVSRNAKNAAPQAVLARAGALAGIGQAAWLDSVPIILMRPFNSSGAPVLPAGAEVAGEMQLPLRRAELDQLARSLAMGDFSIMREASAARRRTIELPDFSGLAVLAVDDTAVNREVLNEALTSFGIAADLAESGEEALEKVQAKAYDIIFMDCSMPGMDGFTATGLIRAMEAEAGRKPSKVIALTAHVGGGEALRWQEAGMDAYIAKPFTLPQLASVIEPVADGSIRTAAPPSPLDIQAAPPPDWRDAPLVAQETLDMFAMLSGANGASVAGKVFGLFQSHAPKGLQDLMKGLEGAYAEGAKLAHALKSMCNSAGARRAALICQAIEDSLKSEQRPEQEWLDALAQAIEETVDAMSAFCAGGNPETKGKVA